MSAFGSLDSLLPVEAIDEFRVQTANTPGDLGRLPGANVSLTSRSGSNEFHGGVVYRFRHELLAANDWFANVSGEGRAPLRLHDVAPSLGGPVRRDRTFFFLSYQHMALRGPYVSRQPVPSRRRARLRPTGSAPRSTCFPCPTVLRSATGWPPGTAATSGLRNSTAAWRGSITRSLRAPRCSRATTIRLRPTSSAAPRSTGSTCASAASRWG